MANPHTAFEWDVDKAASNANKHGVTFEDAARVLADPMGEAFHLENFDDEHSTEEEDRWITIGSEPEGRDVVLVIIWARVEEATRIISARIATKRERREYDREIAKRLEE